MPRNMSFAMTTQQVIGRTKDVTRRFGWDHLRIGDRVWAVEKAMGLKSGQKVKRLCLIEIVSIKVERADAITKYPDPNAEIAREGFPDMDPAAFVDMLCRANRRDPCEPVNRIEFKYVDAGEAA